MRVERHGKEPTKLRYALGCLEEREGERDDGGHAHVVGHVRDSDAQQLANGFVAAGVYVRCGDGVRLLLLVVHERDARRNSSADILVRCILGFCEQLSGIRGLRRCAAQADHAHGNAGGRVGDGGVCVQKFLQLLVDVGVL